MNENQVTDPRQYPWNPAVWAAAKSMHKRLRVADPDLPKWSKLDQDTTDHYCIAAENAIKAFHRVALNDEMGK